jgi:hypothetical protein
MTIVKFMLSTILVAMGGIYPLMKETVLTWGNFGKITLPAVLGINHGIRTKPFTGCASAIS